MAFNALQAGVPDPVPGMDFVTHISFIAKG
jgi:hypothetical protein